MQNMIKEKEDKKGKIMKIKKPNIKSLNFLMSNSLVFQRDEKELINLI